MAELILMTVKLPLPKLKEFFFIMERDPENWAEMEAVALLFMLIKGYKARRSVTLKGVRGEHKIDVYGQTSNGKLIYRVIVECKYWNQKVKKAHVASLASIIEDVGASKGIIISKKGFQKGAVLYANLRPIELMDLNDVLFEVRYHLLNIMEALIFEELRRFKEELERAKDLCLFEMKHYLKNIESSMKQVIHEHFSRYILPLQSLESDLMYKSFDWKIEANKKKQNEVLKSLWREFSLMRDKLKTLKKCYRKPDYIC